SRLPQSYLIAVGAKRKKCTSTAGRVSRSATAFNFCIQGQIRLTHHLIIGSQVGFLFPGSLTVDKRPKARRCNSQVAPSRTGKTVFGLRLPPRRGPRISLGGRARAGYEQLIFSFRGLTVFANGGNNPCRRRHTSTASSAVQIPASCRSRSRRNSS